MLSPYDGVGGFVAGAGLASEQQRILKEDREGGTEHVALTLMVAVQWVRKLACRPGGS